jgi:aryl-alcohol dehydrogenase-like predicted oxidoreductase
LIKSVGVSNYNIDQLVRTHKVLSSYGIPLATNQVEFSILRSNPLHNGLLTKCKELGITMIAYSPLGMGRLSGKYGKSNPPPKGRYKMEV